MSDGISRAMIFSKRVLLITENVAARNVIHESRVQIPNHWILSCRAHLDSAPDGPRTVPVRSALPGTKALISCSAPQQAEMLRTGTVRGPEGGNRCAPS